MVVNPSESKANYEYKEQCKLLARATLKKYKKNNGDLL